MELGELSAPRPGSASVHFLSTITSSNFEEPIRLQNETTRNVIPSHAHEAKSGDYAISPSDRLGGDHSTGPQQRTGIVAEGGTAHPDDTLGGALQPEGLEVPGCWIAAMRRQGGAILTDL